VRFQGRSIDPIALWSDYVDFPANMSVGEHDEFLPLVQCPNPDHHTEKRHFQINVDKPLVHCFAGCGISGTYEHAISMIEGIKPREARKQILKHSRVGGVQKKRRRTTAVATISPDQLFYDRYIPPFGMEYLQSRGITAETIAKFEVGWSNEERRIVIPVNDSRGRTRLLCRRAVREKDQPKYLYTEGVERNSLLYGIGQIDLGMIQSFGIILVEGSIDTWVMHQKGFPVTVGILGSKLSEIQAKTIANLRPKKIYCMFDADGSGISATYSAINLLSRIPIRVVRYSKGYTDPGSLVKCETEQVERMIRRAVSRVEFHKIARELQAQSSNTKERISVG